MQINQGIGKNINKIKITPENKSIQLAKFFQNPKLDFIKNIIPKKIKIWLGRVNPEINIKITPPIKSTAPNILTSIFFKSRF
ncbi:MAG: hypothetical protein PHP92_04475 [Candidatus Nanoarchaeia archaeon]|nr:hypothetical protein [Candidatus Nanoarchaeia archaeon]